LTKREAGDTLRQNLGIRLIRRCFIVGIHEKGGALRIA
jgi:hypothetical protein